MSESAICELAISESPGALPEPVNAPVYLINGGSIDAGLINGGLVE